MTYAHLFKILDDAGLSPEAAARRFGVSNMTLRRWRARAGDRKLPEKYERAFKPVIAQLAAEGKLPADVSAAATVRHKREDFKATLRRLGFPEDVLASHDHDPETLIEGLRKVGEDERRRAKVEQGAKRLIDFEKMGADWKERVGGLMKVLRAKDVGLDEKLVAYGALFYLLTPIDLIPDAIPMIGLLDDLVILGLALWFYRDKLPKLFKKR